MGDNVNGLNLMEKSSVRSVKTVIAKFLTQRQ